MKTILFLVLTLAVACGPVHVDSVVVQMPAPAEDKPVDNQPVDEKPQDEVDTADQEPVVLEPVPGETLPVKTKYLYNPIDKFELGELLGYSRTDSTDLVAFKTANDLVININISTGASELLTLGFDEIGCVGNAVIMTGYGMFASGPNAVVYPSTIGTTNREFWQIGEKRLSPMVIKSWGRSDSCNNQTVDHPDQYEATKLVMDQSIINNIYTAMAHNSPLTIIER
jgi:hypothetical protein